MKHEEKERLHEQDRFIKFMSGLWDRITARRTVALSVVVAFALILVATAVVGGVREVLRDRALNRADTAETIEEMEAAVAKHPDVVDLRMRLGVAYVQSETAEGFSKAEGHYQAAVNATRNPLERGAALLALGQVKMELKKYTDAAEVFDAAARIEEAEDLIGDAAIWHAGRCYELMGEADKAAARYESIGSLGGNQGEDLWRTLAGYRQMKMKQGVLD
jgi:tetratricopeptide (TPR) repeat protein